MAPKDAALLLRSFLNTHKLTLSDLRKAQIYLLNGRLGDGIGKGSPTVRSPQIEAIWFAKRGPQESCST